MGVRWVKNTGRKNTDLKYPLEKRALAYFARLINHEVNRFKGDDSYNNIRKVLALWIIPTADEPYIERYKIYEDTLWFNHPMAAMDTVF